MSHQVLIDVDLLRFLVRRVQIDFFDEEDLKRAKEIGTLLLTIPTSELDSSTFRYRIKNWESLPHVPCIKLVRAALSLGLKEAKDLCEGGFWKSQAYLEQAPARRDVFFTHTQMNEVFKVITLKKNSLAEFALFMKSKCNSLEGLEGAENLTFERVQ